MANKRKFNDTIIRNGMIIKIRKDGTVRSVVGPYVVNHKKEKK